MVCEVRFETVSADAAAYAAATTIVGENPTTAKYNKVFSSKDRYMLYWALM